MIYPKVNHVCFVFWPGDTVTLNVQPMWRVTYHHILFDQHEVVFAEDAEFHAEITTLFPEMQSGAQAD